MELPFDAVLTTNYTFEIEHNVSTKFTSLKDPSKFVHTTEKSKEKQDDENNHKESLYGFIRLFEYNNLKGTSGIEQNIWHIHGNVRVPSSIVLTHDEYARLTKAIMNYNSTVGNRYSDAETVEFRSWIDYLILGDIYIVGLGFDFSEFDLWWLLNRRIRGNTLNGIGKVVFYEPASRR